LAPKCKRRLCKAFNRKHVACCNKVYKVYKDKAFMLQPNGCGCLTIRPLLEFLFSVCTVHTVVRILQTDL